jgi:ribosomal protein S18 acetylase RimI-like enzyme
VQLLTNPQTAIGLISRFKGGSVYEVANEAGYELRPIVIIPHARGKGLAAELLEKLLADARRRGYPFIHLITETDNLSTNAFYRKQGFVLTSHTGHRGIGYKHYRRATKEISVK